MRSISDYAGSQARICCRQKGSAVLVFLTCGIAVIPFLGFVSYLLAWVLLLPAFILSIVVMAKGGLFEGMTILLFTST